MPLTPSERVLRARLAAHTSWANTPDPSARAAKGQAGLTERFRLQVDPDGLLSPGERDRRVDQLRKAHMARLALKSAQARRRKTDNTDTGVSG